MENSIKAYQGKSFSVTLQSMIGSTNYGWCLMSLPACVVLAGQSNDPVAPGIAPVNQVFYFLVSGTPSKEDKVELDFGLFCLSNAKSGPEESVTVTVEILEEEEAVESSFVKYSENTAFYAPDQVQQDLQANLMYGYPCSGDECASLKYGYPSIPAYKYGYPCSNNECASLKYGYPSCDTECANLKYGYPSVVKYGYPLMPVVKYGYPSCK